MTARRTARMRFWRMWLPKTEKKYDAPVLGRIPLDPAVCASGDAGVPFMRDRADTPVGRAFAQIVAALEKAAAERKRAE